MYANSPSIAALPQCLEVYFDLAIFVCCRVKTVPKDWQVERCLKLSKLFKSYWSVFSMQTDNSADIMKAFGKFPKIPLLARIVNLSLSLDNNTMLFPTSFPPTADYRRYGGRERGDKLAVMHFSLQVWHVYAEIRGTWSETNLRVCVSTSWGQFSTLLSH